MPSLRSFINALAHSFIPSFLPSFLPSSACCCFLLSISPCIDSVLKGSWEIPAQPTCPIDLQRKKSWIWCPAWLTLLTSDKQMGHQGVYKRGLKQRCPSGWSVYPGRCNGYFAFPSHNGQEYPEFFCSNYNSPPYNGARFPNVSYKKNRFRASSVDRHSLAGPRKTRRASFSS